MFLAFFSTCLFAFSDIFFKKSFEYKIGAWIHDLTGLFIPMILLAYCIYNNDVFSGITALTLGVYLLLILSDTSQKPLRFKIYSEEKLSLIIPYTNLSKVFTIIISFFLYQDVSIAALVISLFAVLAVIIGSIDFQDLRFPRNFGKILLLESKRTFGILVSGWLILNYGAEQFFSVYILGISLFTLLGVILFKEFKDISSLDKPYWINRTIGALGWVGWFLGLFVIKNLGISISVLLGFTGIAMTLIFSYILLGDKPSKKNLLLTIIVSGLIGIGYYLK